MKLLQFLLLFIWQFLQCPESSALLNIPPKLNQQFYGKDSLSVMLTMKDSADKVFNSIRARRFANSDDRTTEMVAQLQAHAATSQKPVLDHLSRKSSMGKVTSFWITNKILIEKATRASLLELLDAHGPSIEDVRTLITVSPAANVNREYEDKYDSYEDKEFGGGISDGELTRGAAGPGIYPQPGGGPVNPTDGSLLENWGVANIGADEAQKAGYDGRGKVVGMLDSGARWTHEALRNNLRPTYNWFDPNYGTYYTKPVDVDGFGTHRTGIAVGRLGIGVAPGSEWIACRGFLNGQSTEDILFLCAQWMLCPTLVDGSAPDCSKRPDVVSNSWIAGQMNLWFNDAIVAWQLAGITPVFSIGNFGPECTTLQSPGDYNDVIGVGYSNINNVVGQLSSRGPTSELHARIKPDFCAPGRSIVSASFIADNQYLIEYGSSTACPHMAGAVAVYKQKYPGATFTQVLEAFQNTAYQWKMSENACNFKSTNITATWPNNYCGSGIIRLSAALGITGKPNGGSGWST